MQAQTLKRRYLCIHSIRGLKPIPVNHVRYLSSVAESKLLQKCVFPRHQHLQ
jgi:hypothetical protein